jgi:hypothetical protein
MVRFPSLDVLGPAETKQGAQEPGDAVGTTCTYNVTLVHLLAMVLGRDILEQGLSVADMNARHATLNSRPVELGIRSGEHPYLRHFYLLVSLSSTTSPG